MWFIYAPFAFKSKTLTHVIKFPASVNCLSNSRLQGWLEPAVSEKGGAQPEQVTSPSEVHLCVLNQKRMVGVQYLNTVA